MNATEIKQTLEQIRDADETGTSTEFARESITQFLTALGYEDENIHWEVALPSEKSDSGRYRPDAIIAKSSDTRPWLAIDSYNFVNQDPPTYGKLDGYGQRSETFEYLTDIMTTNASLSVVISDEIIAYSVNSKNMDGFISDHTQIKHLDDLDEFIGDIIDKLSPPDSLPTEQTDWDIFGPSKIESDYFEMSLESYESGLEATISGVGSKDKEDKQSTNNKGDLLENLTKHIIGSTSGVIVRESNRYTKRGEYDLILERNGEEAHPVFDEFDRFIPVECKNVPDDSVGTDDVNHFIRKVRCSGCKAGILVTTGTVSGDRGKYALSSIRDSFENQGITIAVIRNSELQELKTGRTFPELLDDWIFDLRFPK
ncbi:restriction endonuclease [Natrinema hispanicum]|uniref:Restriction endonuclease n=1 Tax=Natrinema hispanicum TaxID=392421 RepID=A0A1I0F912_9EURY|nr:restriction endonuclease [Natrinema hispanicum]SET54397.1 Restriction endonuclease [Natrinema hispanicum]